MNNNQALQSIAYKIKSRDMLAEKQDALIAERVLNNPSEKLSKSIAHAKWLNKGKDWMKLNLQKFFEDLNNGDFSIYPHTQEGINYLQRKVVANRNIASRDAIMFSIRHQFIIEARQIRETLKMFDQ